MADIILVMPLANRFDKISIRIPNGLLAIAALPDKLDEKENKLLRSINFTSYCAFPAGIQRISNFFYGYYLGFFKHLLTLGLNICSILCTSKNT